MNHYPLCIMHLGQTKCISRRIWTYLDQNSGETFSKSKHLVKVNNVGGYFVKPTSIVTVEVIELTEQGKVFSHSSTIIRGGWVCLSACVSYCLKSNMNSVLFFSFLGKATHLQKYKIQIRQIDFCCIFRTDYTRALLSTLSCQLWFSIL